MTRSIAALSAGGSGTAKLPHTDDKFIAGHVDGLEISARINADILPVVAKADAIAPQPRNRVLEHHAGQVAGSIREPGPLAKVLPERATVLNQREAAKLLFGDLPDGHDERLNLEVNCPALTAGRLPIYS